MRQNQSRDSNKAAVKLVRSSKAQVSGRLEWSNKNKAFGAPNEQHCATERTSPHEALQIHVSAAVLTFTR